MESIEVGHYKKDKRSRYVYLCAARVKTAELQGTEEKGIVLLDAVFEVPLENSPPCEFLIRLETAREALLDLSEKLSYALEHPKPHPWQHDLFYKAVTGQTPFEEGMELVKKYAKKNGFTEEDISSGSDKGRENV